MKTIVTITLNPALDLFWRCHTRRITSPCARRYRGPARTNRH